jgi:hypothetical protein
MAQATGQFLLPTQAPLRASSGEFVMRENLLKSARVDRRAFANTAFEEAERNVECGDMSPLSDAATCRGVSKREHVRALQGKGCAFAVAPFARPFPQHEN